VIGLLPASSHRICSLKTIHTHHHGGGSFIVSTTF
jgi:hypothetical protein